MADVDALVVGAGPVGLMAAGELRRHGMTVRVVDRAPAASDKSKALALWSRTLEIFSRADTELLQAALAAGQKVHGSSFYAEGKRLAHLNLDEVPSPFPYALMLPQYDSERLLAESLGRRGVTVERNTELLRFTQDEHGVSAILQRPDGSEESVRAAWMLGCDGAHSTVRHGLGLEFEGEANPSDWILADVDVEGPVALDEVSVFWSPDGVLAVFPIQGPRVRIIADRGTAQGDAKPADPDLSEVQAVVEQRGLQGVTLKNPFWLAGF
ncbi:MAG: FAD-dependent monooxygenase, partial [Candidatus Eremiobacterota bacterium]